ncbi:ras-related and estrogen-regulated growth inhibitor-like protein isoform X1 [Ornithodoros turicata]|uniref:ras-related and estrogen-regulated growth inhibitor-like protein isoform X1 n=1 Tax=Ornithodoros turicata TaxID=34597 RepID=UPI003139EBE0
MILKMTQLSSLKIVVLGSKEVGKSAVIVRFLTKRFIGEYKSNSDWLYKQSVACDDVKTNIEILDISRWTDDGCPPKDQMRWADAFVVIYSICDKTSFQQASDYAAAIRRLHTPSYVPILLLGNKLDLEHCRQVSVEEAQELCTQYSCQFYEVSAADNCDGVELAFHNFLREARTLYFHRSLPRTRKLSIVAVSKVFGAMFGNRAKVQAAQEQQLPDNNQKTKKRPSLSL